MKQVPVPRLLKELAKSLTKPLCIIFKQSLRLKMTPKEWKKATKSAIFKKGNRSMAGNYKSVSLTSVVCKLLEKNYPRAYYKTYESQ
jgi:hypothetical protein